MLSMQEEPTAQPQKLNQQQVKPQGGAMAPQAQGGFKSQQSSGARRWGSYGAQPSAPSSGGWGQPNQPKAAPATYSPNFGAGGNRESDAQMKGGVGAQAQPYTAPSQPTAPQSIPQSMDPTAFWSGGAGSPVRPSTPAPQAQPEAAPDSLSFWQGRNGSPVRQNPAATPQQQPPMATPIDSKPVSEIQGLDAQERVKGTEEAPSFFGIPRYGRSFIQY